MNRFLCLGLSATQWTIGHRLVDYTPIYYILNHFLDILFNKEASSPTNPSSTGNPALVYDFTKINISLAFQVYAYTYIITLYFSVYITLCHN